MLYIKNGRLYTASFSFALPEGMCIVTDPEGVCPDRLNLESLDGKFQIDIGAWTKDESPKEQLEYYINYAEHVLMGEFIEVDRGGMKGYGVFHRNKIWQDEYYQERLAYPMNEDGQNVFDLRIYHEVFSIGERNQVAYFMRRPNIKAFLDSIRYEPNVCKRIIK